MPTDRSNQSRDQNRDPLSGEPGAHPVGTGVGAAVGGAAAGAAAGSVAGPVGTVVGAVAGAVGGGLAGKAIAENIDPTAEDAYWRSNYSKRPYYSKDVTYETYAPAYRHGWESRSRFPDRRYEDVEPELRTAWEKSNSKLSWDKARLAARDAWDRLGSASQSR
jgi:phage tail tape-measure protein